MRAGVIRAYILKEFKDLARTKMLYLVYILPTMILLLFGYGIRMEVTHARTIILDRDNSKLSLDLIGALEHTKYFDTHVSTMSEQEALRLIKKGEADILIIIPTSLQKHILKHQKAQIGVYIDGAYPMRALTMQSYVEGEIVHLAQKLLADRGLQGSLITINHRTLFNQAMRDENAIVPGLIGLILLVAPAILAALLIVKEKELGTIFNFYASPIGKTEFLIAKLTPVFLLHSLNIFILFLWAVTLFGVPFRGSFTLYWMASELYLFSSLGIGLLVSIITRRQIVAVVLTVIITLIPGFLYSGILMPISSMQGASAIEAHLFPVMYYNHIVYDTFLVGEGLASAKTALYLGILALYGTTLLLLGSLLLQKELR